jgi:hypothetical protein
MEEPLSQSCLAMLQNEEDDLDEDDSLLALDSYFLHQLLDKIMHGRFIEFKSDS